MKRGGLVAIITVAVLVAMIGLTVRHEDRRGGPVAFGWLGGSLCVPQGGERDWVVATSTLRNKDTRPIRIDEVTVLGARRLILNEAYLATRTNEGLPGVFPWESSTVTRNDPVRAIGREIAPGEEKVLALRLYTSPRSSLSGAEVTYSVAERTYSAQVPFPTAFAAGECSG